MALLDRPLTPPSSSLSTKKPVHSSIELTFHMKYKEKVLSTYLPYVLERSDTIEEENRVVKLYSLGNFNENYNGPWTSINVDHPSAFDTLAMEPMLKKELIADFDRLVKRWEIILSGLLDFIDGLWSSFGDERIIMLTTNHKERLDPALLRLTCMDMHIQMFYHTRSEFNILASNYLSIKSY
ncbi:AAA-ATPase At3g50940-like [Vitis riparia]|uniref:AAA-ATPase At3g50940-like n=1 Tax=Vitis riparia TaxID=96939 RepID=UPI00155A22FB|nr:AAA-ATPase At3g50940-like [Vitis riparia]